MRRIDEIIIHCAATPRSMDIGAEEIRQWHLDRGWSDIGYHYVIRRGGKIEDGRPVAKAGAHARGRNARSIGICLVGGIDAAGQAESNYTQHQWRKLEVLVRRLRGEYPAIRSVIGHRDIPGVAKDCPCFDVGSWLTASDVDAYSVEVGGMIIALTREEIARLRDSIDSMLAA